MRNTKFLYAAIVIAIAILISSFKFLFPSHSEPNVMNPVPQQNEFIKEWKTIDSLINIGLPKSALDLTEKIYTESKRTGNHPQFIKSVLYKIKLTADFQEDFLARTAGDIKTEIAKSETPVKQILHSIEADIYWRYYQSNRYRFMDRTSVVNVIDDDIQTWDLKKIMQVVILNFRSSLDDAEALKKINLKEYNTILNGGLDSKAVRPTLYDFLAHRAVDFFMNDESGLTQPAYTFEIDQPAYFDNPSAFSKLELESDDSLSLKFYALQILQELTRFHMNDKDLAPLVDLNLKRLGFVYNNAILQDKDQLYLDALQRFEKDVIGHPESTQVSLAIANQLNQTGQQYNPLVSEDHHWEIKQAFEKCNEAIQRFPDSDGAHNCRILLAQIQRIFLQITTENVVVPDQPILALLDFKNINQTYFRILKVDYDENKQWQQGNRNRDELIKKYLDHPAFREWQIELPNNVDFQPHSTEFKIDALPAGYFVLLASNSNEFSVDSNAIFYSAFWSSHISYISEQTNKNTYRFYTLHRETGQALENVAVELFYQAYDYRTREYNLQSGGNFISDKNGYFEIPALSNPGRSNSFFLTMKWEKEELITDDRYYHSSYSEPIERRVVQTSFFTDRAIYRPGQTIYFKGIVLEQFRGKYEIKPGFSTSVIFNDVNYQKIAELKLSSNEYGSFSGSFIAPTGGLNGRMTIQNGSGSQMVTVEEYKRPTFEVAFEPVEGSYKLNEMVSVKGIAKAYAGNLLPGTQVKYRVVREVRFPWRYYFWDFWPAEQSSMEITNGLTETNEKGQFSINFKAIPDYGTPQKYKPVFAYTVYTDVTDITGETRSAQTTVNVGYNALSIDIQIGDAVNRDDLKEIKFLTTNLNGQSIQATGTLTLSKLKEPARLLREKYWQSPDIFIIPENEYKNNFSYDSYKQEGKLEQLDVSSVILTRSFDSKSDSIIKLESAGSMEPGRYAIKIATKDEFGDDVEQLAYFTLFAPGAKKPPVNEISWFNVMKTTCEPGDEAEFIVGTNDKNVRILYEVVRQNEILKSEWLSLSNEQRKISFPVTEDLHGGFSINLYAIKHNRSFQNSFRVDVPYTNKALDFEYITFRDKLVPGQKEEWKIKIKGKQGDKVAAELLTSMYDASLDAFLDHSWNLSLYPAISGNLYWNINATFSSQTGYSITHSMVVGSQPIMINYDQLNWFGFDYYGGYPKYKRGMEMDGIAMEQQAMPGQAMELNGALQVEDEDIKRKDKTESTVIEQNQSVSYTGPQIRRDFRETAFFFPALHTDENGDVLITFDMPESLTRWKLMGLAYTKDLKLGQFEKEVVTSKDLMIVPNPPRFFRQGDQMTFAAKVVNLSENDLNGVAILKFFNPLTMQDITGEILKGDGNSSFKVLKDGSSSLSWNITIPDMYSIVSYQISAKAGNYTDGEEKPIPVLTNRMLVTESLPLPVKGNETRNFIFEKLKNSSKKGTLKNHRLTLEFSSNPAWYAVQALPYIMENSENESADAAFNRFYANGIASYLANSNPKIRNVFDAWRNFSPDALLSNLEKNQELKSVILNETPWVLDARNEKEQKQRIALLFDLNKMGQERDGALRKLMQQQSPGGGWSWFKGMPDNRYISQQIVMGLAHLRALGVFDAVKDPDANQMLIRAIRYIDQEMKSDYDWIKEHDPDHMEDDHLNQIQIHYLLARSYFMKEVVISKNQEEAFAYFRDQAIKHWVKREIYSKGMIALALNNLGVKSAPSQIMASIKEYALYSDEMGMYFRDNRYGYYWYEAPIETQALMIEAFDEIMNDQKAVEQMKIWLLKQKQTQAWETSKATVEAVYVLLLRGSDWLTSDQLAEIKMGKETIDPMKREDTRVEAGTGYFKTSWSNGDIKPEMGTITVKNQNPTIAWGAVYWQYFEDLDKITAHETPLQLKKQLFVERNTASGPIIETINEGELLHVSDKVIVRIELRVDRDMEFVHMKDMRASALEPVNVISGYRYQDGLGYYESTLDASTNFFFDFLRKGTYVFEYPLVVSQKGDFSNGITTIQCMYAPEFTSHSAGVRVKVE